MDDLMDVRSKTSAMVAKTFPPALILIAIFLMNAPLTLGIARVRGEKVFENTMDL